MVFVKEVLGTVLLQFAHQVQLTSLIPGQLLCLNCFIKINQNNKELEDHENDPTFTPDTLPTYVERARDASFSALDILCIRLNVLVKGKRLLWAYESYYRHLLL